MDKLGLAICKNLLLVMFILVYVKQNDGLVRMDPLRSMFLTGGGSSDRNRSFAANNGLDVFYTFTGKSV